MFLNTLLARLLPFLRAKRGKRVGNHGLSW
jgi:hypothetical protein